MAYSFAETIKKHLDDVAKTDKTFAKNYEKKNKSLDECVNYIIGEARKRKNGAVAAIPDDEVYGMAIHYFDEYNIKVSVKDALKDGVSVTHGTSANTENIPAKKKSKTRGSKTVKMEVSVKKTEPEDEPEDEVDSLEIPLFD